MEARVTLALVWCGPLMTVLWIGAFVFVAGFIPPSDPMASAEEIVKLYAENTTGIRLGLVIAMLGSALLVPFGVAISRQLKNIKGAKPLADTQLLSCALFSVEFIVPIALWMGVAYRFDGRAADITRTLHDVGWIMFVAVTWSLWVQLIATGIAIFIDKKPVPTFPRWVGYLNLWVALLIIPTSTVLFFKSGPFAWNGLIGLYIPLASYVIWFIGMTWAMHKSLILEIRGGNQHV